MLAAVHKRPPGRVRPLKIVLVAYRKDHGPHEHNYPLWMERWKTLLGGKGAGPANLYGPAADTSKGPAPGATDVTVETARDWPSAEQFARADLVVAFFGTGGIWNQARLRESLAGDEEANRLCARSMRSPWQI